MVTLSERLIQLKTENQMLQKDIAEGTELALRTYQYYEKGERIPDANVIIKLCRYFNVSSDYLLGLSDEPVARRNDEPLAPTG